MQKIILDCDLMKYRNSGLYYYCLNLGLSLIKIIEKERNEKIFFYGRMDDINVFGRNYLLEKKQNFFQKNFRPLSANWYKKIINNFGNNREVWHAPFQSGRIVPVSNDHLKVLLTIHDLNQLHEDVFTHEQRAQSLKITQKLIDRSSAIVCISDFCKQDVLNNLDVKQKPVYVIHNGTNQLGTPPIKPAAYQPVMPFLFTLGYINRKKNFHTLISLLTIRPNLELIIAGKPDDADYLEGMKNLAADLGVAERLHIVEQISDSDKAWYFKHCLAFMFPSLAEGFGLPVTEAMSFGKPLFLSDKTSLPEIGGDVAFYFSSFDPAHMQDVFEKGMVEYERNNLYDKIIERSREFSWDNSAKEYLKVYRSLLN